MDAIELWETTMNPENRKLIQVTIKDAEMLLESENILNLLMGEKVEPRKEFIINNALSAELDY